MIHQPPGKLYKMKINATPSPCLQSLIRSTLLSIAMLLIPGISLFSLSKAPKEAEEMKEPEVIGPRYSYQLLSERVTGC